MVTLTIQLSEEKHIQLQQLAEVRGVGIQTLGTVDANGIAHPVASVRAAMIDYC